MSKLTVISKRRFDALCYVRDQNLHILGKEILWFETACKKLLSVLVFDYTDSDFNYIILGRDKQKLFRCIDVKCSFKSIDEAVSSLALHTQQYINDGKVYYSQGDERSKPNEIFNLKIPRDKANRCFIALKESPSYEAARNLIQEIAYHFIDVDGNYIQEFQENGFNARLWELFLHAFFNHLSFRVERKYPSPDFCASMYGMNFFIEAVTVNPSKKEGFDIARLGDSRDIRELSYNYLPIKFHNTLYNKVSRKSKYWDLPHVKGHPFLFAIHDYHISSGLSGGSMCWSREGLFHYLYGIGIDKHGNTKEVNSYTYKGITRPANFFGKKEHRYVSAVLFSNGATLATFNRMGKLAGLGSKNIKILRQGYKWDPIKENPVPFFSDIDDEGYEEAWSDTVIMYHNPKAKFPVDPRLFPEITHVFLNVDSQNFIIVQNPNEIYSSRTINISA